MSGSSDRPKDIQDYITMDNTKILNVMPRWQLAANTSKDHSVQTFCNVYVMSMQSQPGVEIPQEKKSGAV